jgi:hypothetical protein
VGRRAAAVALVVAAAAGCGAKTPDYQSIWSTTSTTPTPTTTEAPMPIAAYLEKAGVAGEPVAPQKLPDLTVTMPQPKGWQQYNNPNFVPGTHEAIKHGYADAELSQNFKRLNASTDNFKGFPSSMIEGSYDANGRRMHSYNRIVIATGAPPANQRYLVQFTVTGYAEKAAEEAPDIEAVIGGFNIAVPGAPPK